MKYVLTLATLILALTHESLAQNSVSSILDRIISSEDKVIVQGNVIEPNAPVFSLSGTYGNDDNLTYVVDYKGRGKEYNLFSLMYFDLASTDMVVLINDDAYNSDDNYAGAWLFAVDKSGDKDF